MNKVVGSITVAWVDYEYKEHTKTFYQHQLDTPDKDLQSADAFVAKKLKDESVRSSRVTEFNI